MEMNSSEHAATRYKRVKTEKLPGRGRVIECLAGLESYLGESHLQDSTRAFSIRRLGVLETRAPRKKWRIYAALPRSLETLKLSKKGRSHLLSAAGKVHAGNRE